jgi:uncharacterized protein YfaA (DUF2138 family)
MGVGGEGRYTVSRKLWSAERSTGVEVSTRILRLAQARPPLPVDADRSSARESHSPIVLGADTATVGATALAGAAITTSVRTDAVGHFLASQAVVEHLAFNSAALARATTLSTVAHCVAVPLTAAATEESLTHMQDEVGAQTKLNRALHGKVVPVPALSVLTSKLISRVAPSLVNAAEVKIGAGSGEDVDTTAKLLLAGYCTSYW